VIWSRKALVDFAWIDPFHGGIIPILKAFGNSSQITRVTVPIPFSLFQFSSNDTYCPNLLVLNLIENVLQTDRPWA
jgi:hypothetical protein